MRVTSMQSLYNSYDLESSVNQHKIIDVKKNNLNLINKYNNQGITQFIRKNGMIFIMRKKFLVIKIIFM